MLWSLTAAFALGWLFILIANGQSTSSSAVSPVFNLGISLFLGTLITALILDFRGFLTLRGSITWRQAGILLGLVYLAFFFFGFGVYLYRLFREAQRPAARPEVAPAATSFGGRPDPRHSTIFGVLCVALITACWFAAASAGASTAASPQATQVANSGHNNPTNTPYSAATNGPATAAPATDY